MSYTITLTDGAIFATVADGTINTASSMTLVGKNYAGYGQFLDTNFIRLLENGSNTTAPGSPLEGQLWWDSGASLLKVYNGTTFKTISAATASSGAPTSNVTGDLWYDTVNQQLKVYTGTSFLLIGPQFSAGEGTSGAIVATIVDNTSVSHIVVQLFVNDSIVGMISKDATFTPQSAISGFSTIRPGITLSTLIGAQVPLFQGTATNSQLLNSLTSSQFMRSDANTTTTGAMTIFSNNGLGIGENSDLRIGVTAGDVFYRNQTVGGNLYFGVNVAGNTSPTLIMFGSNGAISGNQINANYADVAERFEADPELPPGPGVELGGSAEITHVSTDLSEKVFGVISTRAAYLMNSQAGSDATHPPVAMTGRVPVNVIGQVLKGDRLVSAGNGMARAARPGEITAFNVIGRALRDKLDTDPGTVEAIVTIK
jgi:hypothetical protein